MGTGRMSRRDTTSNVLVHIVVATTERGRGFVQLCSPLSHYAASVRSTTGLRLRKKWIISYPLAGAVRD